MTAGTATLMLADIPRSADAAVRWPARRRLRRPAWVAAAFAHTRGRVDYEAPEARRRGDVMQRLLMVVGPRGGHPRGGCIHYATGIHEKSLCGRLPHRTSWHRATDAEIDNNAHGTCRLCDRKAAPPGRDNAR